MKLPSIDYLYSNAKDSFKKFPLTILSGLLAAIIGIFLTENHDQTFNTLPYINALLCASLGIPLFFNVSLLASKNKFDKRSSTIITSLALLLLVALYFTFPNNDSHYNNSLPYIKYALYNLACHLLVSFTPFLYQKQHNAFWHHNRILFTRFLTSAMYSAFIYIGLILALTALKLLFDVKIHEELYFEIWIVVVGFFNTWFFVSGIQTDLNKLEDLEEYPKGLRIFSQYVLLPLLGLYIVILYAYGTKIMFLWDWPKGIVSYLIICVSILGILSFLLLHPYGNQKENSWIKITSKGYYFLLFPLLVILFIALFMRIDDYGITINRYLLFMLGIWLSIVCIYIAIGKTNIKFIPTSLAIMVLLISFGPWSVFSVSEKSQANRLKVLLEKSKILNENKIQNETIWENDSAVYLSGISELKNEGLVSDSIHNEIKSILDYLDDHHGFAMLSPWFKQDIDSIVTANYLKKGKYYVHNEAEIYMRSMGLDYEMKYENDEQAYIEYRSVSDNAVIQVSGFDYIVNFTKYSMDEDFSAICSYDIDTLNYTLNYFANPKPKLSLQSKTDTLTMDLNALIERLNTQYQQHSRSDIPPKNMQLFATNKYFSIKIEFDNIELGKSEKRFNLKYLSGSIFVKKLNP